MYQATLTSLNHTISSSLAVDLQQLYIPTMSSVDWYGVYQEISQTFTLWTLSKFMVLVFILFNLKNFPLMYHLRLINAFRFVCRSQRPSVDLSSANIFQPIITTSRAPLLELDLNMHKSNSTYFADIDISRTHLLCTLFSKGVAHMRGGTTAITGKASMFNLALGGVTCTFRKELQPFEQYEIWTRVLTWDKKWIYLVTHFVRKGKVEPTAYSLYPHQGSRDSSRRSSVQSSRNSSISESDSLQYVPPEDLIASAMSKCVFKLGRKTISPMEMFKLSGLLPLDTPGFESPESSKDSPINSDNPFNDSSQQWSWNMVERERERGMRVAQMMATDSQQNLEREFTGESSEALGRHRDGTGITGVVTTLAQLAHLSNKQFL